MVSSGRHLSMLRSYTAADLLTIGNAACGTIAIFLCLDYVASGERRFLWSAFALLPAAVASDSRRLASVLRRPARAAGRGRHFPRLDGPAFKPLDLKGGQLRDANRFRNAPSNIGRSTRQNRGRSFACARTSGKFTGDAQSRYSRDRSFAVIGRPGGFVARMAGSIDADRDARGAFLLRLRQELPGHGRAPTRLSLPHHASARPAVSVLPRATGDRPVRSREEDLRFLATGRRLHRRPVDAGLAPEHCGSH